MSRRLLVTVALVLLAIGFVNVTRGLDHPGREYRDVTLYNGSYSDLLAMSGDRYLDGERPVPYVDDRIQYPVIIGLLLWAPSWVPGGQFAYFLASSLLLGACLVWTVLSLRRVPGANPWLFAATPALATYGLLNWDLVGIAFMVAGIAAAEAPPTGGAEARMREALSGALLGLGAATKLFPVAAFPALLRTVRRPVRWLGAAAGVILAVNLPFAIAAFDNWRWFFEFSSKRKPDFAIWNALHITSIGLINVVSLGAVAAAALVALRYGKTPAAARLGTALVIAVWMTLNKVGSPQFSLWVFAAAALVGAPWPIFGALVAVSMFDFSLELWLMPHHAAVLRPLVAVMVVARAATTAWFGWWCLRRLRVEGALDEGTQGGPRIAGDRPGLADGLNLTGR